MKILSVRPMTPADLEVTPISPARTWIKSLRDAHHIVARLMASGMLNTEIALETGYSLARIGQFRADPAMVELVATYRNSDNDSWRKSRDQYYDRVFRTGSKAYRQIEDQLDDAEESGEKISLDRLMKIADSASDRVGYHKRTMNVNVNVDFAKRLDAATQRLRELETQRQTE